MQRGKPDYCNNYSQTEDDFRVFTVSFKLCRNIGPNWVALKRAFEHLFELWYQCIITVLLLKNCRNAMRKIKFI